MTKDTNKKADTHRSPKTRSVYKSINQTHFLVGSKTFSIKQTNKLMDGFNVVKL